MNKKILHFSGTYFNDGATSSVINLNNTIKKKGIYSSVYILKDNNFYKNVNFLNTTILNRIKFFFLSKIESFLIKNLKKNKSFAFFNNLITSNTINVINEIKPDIVHFHWMPRLLDLDDLKHINSKIVVTLRDYWFITGGCNYPVNCNKYQFDCKKCPHLKNLGFKKDISYFNLKKKQTNIKKNINKINIVVPNLEMKSEVKKLNIFDNKKIFYIPNGIDKNIFNINKKVKIKNSLSLKTKKKNNSFWSTKS